MPVVTTDLLFGTASLDSLKADDLIGDESKNVADGAFWDPTNKAAAIALSNGKLTATLVVPVLVKFDMQMQAAVLGRRVVDLRLPLESSGAVGGCPSPNLDGSTIFPNSCTLIDNQANTWAWDGIGPSTFPYFKNNWEFTENASPTSRTGALQRNFGGHIWRGDLIGDVTNFQWRVWRSVTINNGPFQTLSPASGPVGSIFKNLTKNVSYQSIFNMAAAAALGDVLQIPMLIGGPGSLGSLDALGSGRGIWVDGAEINVANVTLQSLVAQGRFGPLIGVASLLGKASIIAQVAGNNLVVKNLHLAYGSTGSPVSGIFQDRNIFGISVQNCLVRGYDHGIITSAGTGGTTSIHNTELHDNGDTTGGLTHGSTHNFYLGNEDACDVQGVLSYNTIGGGHLGKTRTKTGFIGTTQGCTFAQLEGDSSVCLDIPCGGTYSIKNCTFERGPGTLGESDQFINFGTEIAITGNCDMTNRTQSITIDGCIFIDDGPEGFPGSPTIICKNTFSSTGVTVTVKNCKIISNGGVAGGGTGTTAPPAVTLGANVADGGGNTFFASRFAAGLPAYDKTLDCVPPAPDDPIQAVLSGMVVGQWKKLTDVNGGNLLNAIPPVTTGQWRAYYDALFISTNGAQATFASDAACQTSINVFFQGIAIDFSRSGVRAGQKPWVVHTSGGHNTSSGGSADSSILGFDIAAACQAIVANPAAKSSWSLHVASATYLPPLTPNPSWGNYTSNPATTNNWTPDANIYGQHRVAARHGYSGLIWHPAGGGEQGYGRWSNSGFFAESGDASGTIGSVEAFDDTGAYVQVFNDQVRGGNYRNGLMLDISGNFARCDLDGCVYVWTGNLEPIHPFNLLKWTNPTTNPQLVVVKSGLNNSPGSANEVDAVIIPDPINGSSKRALFVPAGADPTVGGFCLMTDITGTPTEYSGATAGTYSTAAPTMASTHQSFCRNDVLGKISVWDGSGQFFPITPNASNPPANWTWTAGANTPSGDIPVATAGDFPRHVYDQIRNCYYCINECDVWLYKPGPNGAV